MIEKMNEQQLLDLKVMFQSQAFANLRAYIEKNRATSVRKMVHGSFADNENDDIMRGEIRRDDKILGLEDAVQKRLRKST